MKESEISTFIQELAMSQIPSASSYALLCYLLGERLKGLQTVMIPLGSLAKSLGVKEDILSKEVEDLIQWGVLKAQKSSQGDWLVLEINEEKKQWTVPLRPPLQLPQNHMGDAKNLWKLDAPGPPTFVGGFSTPLTPVQGGLSPSHTRDTEDKVLKKKDKKNSKKSISHLATYRRKTFRKDMEFRTALAEKVEAIKAHRPLTQDEGALVHVLLNHIKPREQLHFALAVLHKYPGLHETLTALKVFSQKPRPHSR